MKSAGESGTLHRFDDRKVLLGGMAAGVALLVGDLVMVPTLGHDLIHTGRLWLPDTKAVEFGGYVGAYLLIGVFVAWVRAALIPFYGPGIRSAIRAGLAVWLLPMGLPLAFLAIESSLFFGSIEWITLAAVPLSAAFYATAGVAAAMAARVGASRDPSREPVAGTA